MIALIPSENPSRESPDCFIATATALTLAGIAAASASSVAAAKMNSNAANKSADVTSTAANNALQYQQGQAARDQANFESTQRHNYDQWAAGEENDYGKWSAREGRVGQLGELLGMGPRNIPALNIPAYGGGPRGAASVPTGPAQDFIANWQQTHPVSEGIGPLKAALQAKGFNVQPYMYGSTESHNEISLNGEKYKLLGGEDSPAAYWYKPGTYDGGGRPPAYRGNAASLLS